MISLLYMYLFISIIGCNSNGLLKQYLSPEMLLATTELLRLAVSCSPPLSSVSYLRQSLRRPSGFWQRFIKSKFLLVPGWGGGAYILQLFILDPKTVHFQGYDYFILLRGVQYI